MFNMKKIFTTIIIAFFIATQISAQNQSHHAILTNSISLQTSKAIPALVEEATSSETSKRKCATPILNDAYENWVQAEIKKQEQFANSKKVSVVYNIPIIFHIIHTGQAVGSGYNIAASKITQQIARLNADYRKTNTDQSTYLTQASFIAAAADCEINFCAALVSPSGSVLAEPGIERINATSKGWPAPPYTGSDPNIENSVKPGSSWDPTKYFNVWITAFSDGTLGYAQFPTVTSSSTPTIGDIYGYGSNANTDGVVIDYTATGNTTGAYNLGRTLTHESGHWLGLRHIDGDATCGNDYVSDTPQQSTLSGTCPTTAGATIASGCSAAPNPPGRLYQNYMDYSDDKCMVMFTTGQKARIQACMANCIRRTSLNTSTVCSIPNSIGENAANVEMTIFPNPTNGELNVTIDLLNTQDFTISVINTLGQTVKEVKQTQSNGGTVKIDLSSNSAGVYFVTLKSKTISKTKRIILQ